jgi:hypothetical protein
MIKAEIKKNGNLYVFDLTSKETVKEAYAAALLIAAGKENYEDQLQIVDLGTSEAYDHIRVYVEADVVQVAAPEDDSQLAFQLEDSADYMKGFEDRITYLGQDLQLKGIKAVADNVAFVLIYEINEQPAQLTMGKNSLFNLTVHQGRVLGYADPTAIVAAADLLDEEAAVEYVEDYIKELQEERRRMLDGIGKTATAFVDFNKDE